MKSIGFIWDFSSVDIMDEEAKRSETYTMDEVLEKCRSSIGGMDWKENPTRFKLKEVKYFLDKVSHAHTEYVRETTDENRDILLFNLSAFFAAGRSITGNYMQKQYKNDWYKKQNFKFDSELGFLNEMREEFVHFNPHPIVADRGLNWGVTTNIVSHGGDSTKLTHPPLPEIQPSEPVASEPVTHVVFLMPDDKMKNKNPGLKDVYDVLDFCQRQYQKYERLVDECEKRFNETT